MRLSQEKKLAGIFVAALLLQGVHMVEHLAQVYQYAILRFPIFEAHGILFFFDLEWNHFTFNLAYLLLLAMIFIGFKFHSSEYFIGQSKTPRYMFLAGFFVQGYHVIEHAARIGQTLQTGCEPCRGILGWYVNGIWLHFTLNSLVLVLPAAAFFSYRLYRKLSSTPKHPVAGI